MVDTAESTAPAPATRVAAHDAAATANGSSKVNEALRDLREDMQDILFTAAGVLYRHYMARYEAIKSTNKSPRSAKNPEPEWTHQLDEAKFDAVLARVRDADACHKKHAVSVHLNGVKNYKHQKKFEDLTARLQAATAERNRLRRLCLVKAKETLSSFDTHFFSTYRRAVADETCLREEADSLHQRYVALNGVLEDLKSCYERISEEKLLM